MLKWILLGILLWLIWRSWSRFIRETLGRLNKQQVNDIFRTPEAGTSTQASPPPPHASSGTYSSGTRMVRCERCGVFIPFSEANLLQGNTSPESARYQCAVACADSSTASAP